MSVIEFMSDAKATALLQTIIERIAPYVNLPDGTKSLNFEVSEERLLDYPKRLSPLLEVTPMVEKRAYRVSVAVEMGIKKPTEKPEEPEEEYQELEVILDEEI